MVNLTGILPLSRFHEIEADKLGMVLMAKSCYNPHIAPRMWHKIGLLHGSGLPITQFLRTHPLDGTREMKCQDYLETVAKLLPESCPHVKPQFLSKQYEFFLQQAMISEEYDEFAGNLPPRQLDETGDEPQ